MANAYTKFLLLFVMTALPWVSNGADSNPAAPTFTPGPGTYTTAQSVTLTTTAPNAQIRYTTDQTIPMASSPLYSGPLSVDTTTTIKARAFVTGNAHPFVRGLFAIEGYDFTGNATTDSWNSDSNGDGVADTPYVKPASYTVGGPHSHGDIGSNGVLGPGCYDTNKVHGQATANANVAVPTVVYTPPASGYTALSVITGNLTITGTGTGSTIYRTPSVAQKNKHALTITGTGTVVLYVDGAFHVGDVVFAAGSTAKFIVYQNDVSGKGCSFNAKNIIGDPNDPGRFLFVTAFSGTGSNELSLNGGAQFGGVVLAPYAGIKFNGTSDLFGSFFAKNFSGVVNGNFKFHYDEALAGLAWGDEMQSSPVATATYVLKATPPTATPVGGIFTDTVSVALSSPTPGASIHYTLDGTVPTGSSPVYAAPVAIASNATLSAIARKPGWTDSEVMAQAYAIQVAAPIATPAAGNYDHDLLVTLSSATSDAVIRYTTDGSAPTAASTIASGPIPVTRATIVTARAERAGCTPSVNATFTYGFLVAPVSITPGSGNLSAPTHVTLATTTPQAVIRFTVDGSDPTAASPLANGPVLVDQSLTLKAVAYRDGWTASAVSSATYVLEAQPPDVQAPLIEPASGTYGDTIPVTITTLTSGAAIHYSTDGSQPTTSSPTYSAPLSVDRNTTVRAIAVVGSTTSTTSSATYAIQVAPVTANVAPGVYAQAFDVMLGSTTTGAVIRYTLDGSAPTVSSPVAAGAIVIDRSAVVTAIAERDGCLSSPVSAFAYQLQVAPPVIVPGSGTYTAEVGVNITTTTPGSVTRYTLDGSLPNDTSAVVVLGAVTIDRSVTLIVRAFRDGWTASEATTAVYQLRAPAPILAPASGEFSDTVMVAVTSPTNGMVFRATTDGSDPTVTSSIVTSPITVDHSQTLAVIATRDGWLPSASITGIFILNVAPPVPDVAPGRYERELAVTWTTATSNALIHYTTDGSEPTESSPLAVGPILVTASQTLRARAFRTGCTASAITTATYELKVPAPAIEPAPGIYLEAFSATITSTVASAQVHLTTDGSDPAESSPLYGGPVLIDQATLLRARAFRNGWTASDSVSAGYQLQVQKPVLNPDSGAFDDTLLVSANSPTPGAVVRYEFEDRVPTETSPVAAADGIPVDRIASLTAIAFREGWLPSDAATGIYAIQVAQPAVDVAAGVYDHELSVVWITATSGATIRYTLDGSEPTLESPVLAGPLAVTTNTTIKAQGFRDGCLPSTIATVTYELKVPTPVVTPSTGEYTDVVSVTVASPGPQSVAHYTLDGTGPGEASPAVTGPLSITATGTVLTARAYRQGWTPSEPVLATYTLRAAPPVLSPTSTSAITSLAVMATTATPSAQIRYTTDGSQPTSSSLVFPSPLTLTSSATVNAQTFRTGFLPSAVVQHAYTVFTPGSSTPPTPLLRVTYRTSNSIAIAWDLPPIPDNALSVVDFEVQVKQSQMADSYDVPPVNGIPLLMTNTPQSTWTHTDLYSYESSYGSYIPIYEYAVTAIDQAGNRSALSNWVWAVPMQQPTDPLQLSATSVTSYSVDLAWYPSYFYYDYLGTARYEIKRNGTLIGTIGGVGFNQILQPTFSDLTANPTSPYVYTVEAYDGYGPPVVRSQALTVTTIPDYPYQLLPPTHLSLVERTDTTLAITWRAPLGAGAAAIVAYDVYLNGIPAFSSAGAAVTLSGLQPASAYTITVASRDGAGNQSAQSAPLLAFTRVDQSPPSSPLGLRQTGATVTTISLAWDSVFSNAPIVAYLIYRDGLEVGRATGPIYTDSGLIPSTTYQYKVVAFEAGGNASLLGASLNAATTADTLPPGPPTNLQVTVRADTRAVLTWDAPTATDDSGIKNYHIFKHGLEQNPIDGSMELHPYGSDYAWPFTRGAETTHVSGIHNPNSTFGYTVTAVDLAGNESVPTPMVMATSGPDVTPPVGTPWTPTARNLTGRSVMLSWTSWCFDEYRSSIWGDRVRHQIIRDGNVVFSRYYHITGRYEFTDKDLRPGTTYRYQSATRDIAGNATYSEPLLVTTPAYEGPPKAPINLKTTSRTASAITVAWDDQNDPVSCPVILYEVRINGLVRQTESRFLSLSGLASNTTYVVQVRAKDVNGAFSEDSFPLAIVLGTDQVPPTTPGTPTLVETSLTSATLRWSSSSDNEAVAGYRILRDGVVVLQAGVVTMVTDNGLLPDRRYGYAIQAFDAAGNLSPFSGTLRIGTMRDTTPPSIPEDFAAIDVTASSIKLTWSPSTDDTGMLGYHLIVDGNPRAVITATSEILTGFAAESEHHIAVRAVDVNGNQSEPAILTVVTTGDTTAPSVPQNPHFSRMRLWGFAPTNIVKWDRSTDDTGLSVYRVYRDGILRRTNEAGTYVDNEFHDSSQYGDFDPLASYEYRITAVDTSDNESARSAPAIMTFFNISDQEPPTAPTNLTLKQVAPFSATFTFTPGTDNFDIWYHIYQLDGMDTGTSFSPAGYEEFSVGGLQPASTHTVSLVAIDRFGNRSPPSFPLIFTTETMAGNIQFFTQPHQSTPFAGNTCELSVLGISAQVIESDIVYTWSQLSGPGTITFSQNSSNGAKTTHATFSKDGDYVILCIANDPYGSITGSVPIGCKVLNFISGPLSDASPVQRQTAVLTALAAAGMGNDDQIVYTWRLDEGPGPVIFSSNQSHAASTTTVTFPAMGTYTFSCTASLLDYATTSSVTVTNNALTFQQHPSLQMTSGDASTVSLSARATMGGAPESEVSYTWSLVSGPGPVTFSANGSNSASSSLATLQVSGKYQFRCLASWTPSLGFHQESSVTKNLLISVNGAMDNSEQSPLVKPRPFDVGRWSSDPTYRQYYLENPEPGRVWLSAEPGNGIPVIQAVGARRRVIAAGTTHELIARTPSGAPVNFTCVSAGIFSPSGMNIATAVSDSDGMAKVTVIAPAGKGTYTILAASPLASGLLTFVIVVP